MPHYSTILTDVCEQKTTASEEERDMSFKSALAPPSGSFVLLQQLFCSLLLKFVLCTKNLFFK